MRHLMNPLDFSVEELDKLFALADDIEKDPAKYAHKCDGKILATCFYEPSTRTRLSFESVQFRIQGRKCIRYHPHHLLLCGHLRYAPSQGRRSHGSRREIPDPRDQCR